MIVNLIGYLEKLCDIAQESNDRGIAILYFTATVVVKSLLNSTNQDGTQINIYIFLRKN
jgi:hypothetical protein